MMPTLTLPTFWVLLTPDGRGDGSLRSVRVDGSLVAATAEDAWKQFTSTKRAREREAREGWTVRGMELEEWKTYFRPESSSTEGER